LLQGSDELIMKNDSIKTDMIKIDLIETVIIRIHDFIKKHE